MDVLEQLGFNRRTFTKNVIENTIRSPSLLCK